MLRAPQRHEQQRAHGQSDQHADEAEQMAEGEQREDHRQRRQADPFAHQPRRQHQAFDDLADDPDRDEVIWYKYRDRRIGYYHLRHSRLAVPKPDRVKQPRHALLFRTLPDGMVEVVRIAHDAQKLERLLRIALEGDD